MEPIQPLNRTAEQSNALTFVQTNCGDCHSVVGNDYSPNPDAPTFAAIANREGLSERSLTDWLVSAHNYPSVMEFDLSPEQGEMIAQHMLSLQNEGYRPLQ